MEKLLQLYKFVDGVNDTPFPNATQQATLYEFRYDAKRMGNVPTISGTIMHPLCLDNLWGNDLVYVVYNGERYFLKQTPTSAYSNEDTRYKHECDFVSERIVLNDVYFYDVVASDTTNDKPVSNSSNVTFFGDIHEFAQRLNYSLQYAKVGYSVVVDEGISSEAKMISFQDQFFANALQEIYNTYEIPYYFVGKVIHIGFTNNAITRTFKYGVDDALLSITKTNANYKVVNRVTGIGSADNIPYYYPNKDEKGSSKALYNNNSSNITIENESLYKKVKLSDVFTYTNIAKYTHTITNGEQYSFENELTETSANIWELWQVYYPFTIDKISEYVDFDIDYIGNDFRFINIELWNGGQRIATYNKRGEFTRKCGLGDYEIRIGIGIYSEENLPKSYANTIISDIKVSVTQEIDSEIGWYLNNNKYNIVQIKDYGLKVSTTPKDGDKITFEQIGYIKPQMNLMPPIYRETNGNERFYNALEKTYINPQTGEYYTFDNPYVEGKPKEHIVTFDDIKPSIVGMTNASGQRIDMFSEFAYDANDNDEFDEEGNYLHPYFFAKLRKFDGSYGFNLFDHAIEEDEMVISMTNGSCGACNFVIGVDDETQKNIVQVDENGNLLRDSNGNVLFGKAQERQNDTSKYEVWVALKKDIDTFGVIMPNANGNYKPKAGDTFVILHIDLPYSYIVAAEDRLKEQIIKYMAMNNSEKFTFSITFSRIFFAENPSILAQLDENARLQIEYNGKQYELYVSSYSYSMSDGNPLPEIRVELSDTLTIAQNALQNAISEVKGDIMTSVGSIDWARIGLKYFLRKDVDDRAKGKIASDTAIEVGKFVSGASGAIIYVDKTTGQTIAELDKLYVRMKAYFEQLEIVNVNSVGGKQILSPAGALRISNVVDNGGDYYRCYFLNEQDGEEIENRFVVGDQAYCQLFNAKSGILNNISNKYYWRLVVGVGKDYIDLSKNDCDSGSDVPSVGDVVCHKGNRNDVDRQNLIEFSSVDSYSPSIILYQGVNSYSLSGKDIVSFGVDKTTNKAFMNVYGDMYVGDRNNTSYMRYTQENGLELKGRLAVGTTLSDGRDLEEAINNAGGVDYLKEALKESTTVDGGLVQTSLLMLGYTENSIFNVMSGTNGLYDSTKKGGGIAAWYGGPMADKEADNTLVAFAQSLFRFDGSGYLAGGNISWDKDGAGSVAGGDLSWNKDGVITLGQSIKISGDTNETLSSILSFINEYRNLWTYDAEHNAVRTALNLIVDESISFGGIGTGGSGGGGVTALSALTDVALGTLSDGQALVWDSTQLKWVNKNISGGTADSIAWDAITGKPSLVYYDTRIDTNTLANSVAKMGYGYATEGWYESGPALSFGVENYQFQMQMRLSAEISSVVWRPVQSGTKFTWRHFLDAYNYSNYALPLSGGKITSTSDVPLALNRTQDGTNALAFQTNGTSKTYVGYTATHNLGSVLYNYSSYYFLGIKDNGTPHYSFADGTSYTLIHSGNIGSYNAGSASKLGTYAWNLTNANDITFTDYALRYYASFPSSASNIPTSNGYQNAILAMPLHGNGRTAQFYFVAEGKPYYRSIHTDSWNEIAYVTDNVASATKLNDNTAHTAWGQTFFQNGVPKSVSGTLKNVSSITYTNASTIAMLSASNGTYPSAIEYSGNQMRLYNVVRVGTLSNVNYIDLGCGGIDKYNWETWLRIDKGNVLIGTTEDKGYKLDINGGSLRLCANVGSSSDTLAGFYTHSANPFGVQFRVNTSSGNTYIQARREGKAEYFNMLLQPDGGNVLIGTTTDNGHKLNVEGSISANGGIYVRQSGAVLGIDIGAAKSPLRMFNFPEHDCIYFQINKADGSGTSGKLFITGHGGYNNYFSEMRVYAPLNVYGNFTATGAITFGSDARYKQKLDDVSISLEDIANAPLFNYYWTDREDKKIHLGTTAQYWNNTAFKNAVCPTTDEKLWTMSYSEIAVGGMITIARELIPIKREISKVQRLEERVEKLERILTQHNIKFD